MPESRPTPECEIQPDQRKWTPSHIEASRNPSREVTSPLLPEEVNALGPGKKLWLPKPVIIKSLVHGRYLKATGSTTVFMFGTDFLLKNFGFSFELNSNICVLKVLAMQ